jgi:hypothetical protein
VYYGCGVGAIEMARQEARLIGFLAETLQQVAPDVTLLVRPYPMLAETEFFRALRERPNVRFDEDYRQGRKDRSLTREAIFERLNLQEHALAFVHCGTTMGLEGAYFEAPVLFLDLDDIDYGCRRRVLAPARVHPPVPEREVPDAGRIPERRAPASPAAAVGCVWRAPCAVAQKAARSVSTCR